jgi:hypothetical protein
VVRRWWPCLGALVAVPGLLSVAGVVGASPWIESDGLWERIEPLLPGDSELSCPAGEVAHKRAWDRVASHTDRHGYL